MTLSTYSSQICTGLLHRILAGNLHLLLLLLLFIIPTQPETT